MRNSLTEDSFGEFIRYNLQIFVIEQRAGAFEENACAVRRIGFGRTSFRLKNSRFFSRLLRDSLRQFASLRTLPAVRGPPKQGRLSAAADGIAFGLTCFALSVH